MHYSSIDILALALYLIINRGALTKNSAWVGRGEAAEHASKLYRQFLLASIGYFIVDLIWGVLYSYHHIPHMFLFVYLDTIFYFIFMLLTMLTWMRFVVAYLNTKRLRNKALLYAVWLFFTIGVIFLLINRFYPFIFYFNEAHEYVPQPGRYILFIWQILLYVINAVYMLYIAWKASGREKIRYTAVGLTCLGIEIFLLLQILNPFMPFYAMGLLLGTCVIHSYVEAGERTEKETYDNIAMSLAEDYEAIYYINIETGEYREFFTSEEYDGMNVPMSGKDFYAETRENSLRFAHPDDREFAQSLYYKEIMLKNLEGRKSYSYKYRIMIGGESRYFRFTVLRAGDDKHFVLYEKDIDDEVTDESLRRENQKKSITFSRIAESLASNYDVIYYVDAEDSSYVAYQTNNIFGQLEIGKSGENFFEESEQNIPNIIYKGDRDTVADFLNRDHMISALQDHKIYTLDYRIVVNSKPRYTRMTVRKTSDGAHFLVGVEDIDAEVKKEKQVLKALNTEKELARRDELTGTKNKTAYKELEKSVQSNIDNGMDYLPFAIVVCDANDLKTVNDNYGHVAGDEYLKASAKILCDIFTHSPVFRVGGDEFAVFLRGCDYQNRKELMEKLRTMARDNRKIDLAPVLASGMAEYDPKTDQFVSEIFDRADKEMYEDKQMLKGDKTSA